MTKPSTENPPGRPSWSRGARDDFLNKHMVDYRKAERNKQDVSVFYDNVTRLFIKTFGPHALVGDLPTPVVEYDASVLKEVSDHEDEDEGERKTREEFRKDVRKVGGSIFVYLGLRAHASCRKSSSGISTTPAS